ncbi:UNVERIFIED_CONTAM: putative mitochondrial protein [Sesamum radiatum]|uniref:Mitochondrial protein n=1 Tax=Sesamum radiatum TaxID=300843 RepID=A0AAW2RFB4_SESRA
MMWQQRSKAQWLCDRDRNTKFFHATATSRKKRNEIKRIKDMNGNWQEDLNGVQVVLLGYFHNIFARSMPSDRILEEVLNTVRPKVTAEINEALIQPFTEHEVHSALFGMSPLKSPGPDGMPPLFYQKFWHVIRSDVINCVLHVLNSGLNGACVRATPCHCTCSYLLQKCSVRLADILGVVLVTRHEKYLGLSAVAGRSRGELFQGIKDQIWSRVQGWNAKLLSQAGRGVLIKSVLQSIPTYVISCFRLPDYFLRDIEAMLADFWWHSKGERRTHWVGWNKLCRSKQDGGLGFREMKAFNRAPLAKQGWRLLKKLLSLLSQIMRTKYYKGQSFWDAQLGSRPSLTWRSIFEVRDLLLSGCRLGSPDAIIWQYSNKGEYSVQSAYKLEVQRMRQQQPSTSSMKRVTEPRLWSFIWGSCTPPRVRTFVWRACHEALPTATNLAKRNPNLSVKCSICHVGDESLMHVLLCCSFARQVGASQCPYATAVVCGGVYSKLVAKGISASREGYRGQNSYHLLGIMETQMRANYGGEGTFSVRSCKSGSSCLD